MLVRSADTYSLKHSSEDKSYPTLQQHIDCDILIIGANLTGALVAGELLRAGVRTVLVDKHSSAADEVLNQQESTNLIQYESDRSLHDLIDQVGEADGVLSYKLSLWAVHKLQDLIGRIDSVCDYHQKSSLHIVNKEDVDAVKREYETRRRYGFRVDWLDRTAINQQFDFDALGGILSADAAEVNTTQLTQSMYRYLTQRGLRIYNQTGAGEIEYGPDYVKVTTSPDTTIVAKKIMYSTGYEPCSLVTQSDLLYFTSTYSLMTEPITEMPDILQKTLLRGTMESGFTVRATSDDRIVLNGEDEEIVDVANRHTMLPQHQRLLTKFAEWFPDLDVKPYLTKAETVAKTKDGLPYIGEHENYPHSYFAMGFGNNELSGGITAANLLKNLFLRGSCEYGRLFRFGR